jgi:hypothetical protein
MAAAEALHLAAEFEIAFDLFVVKDAEAVDDGDGVADHFDDFIGVEGHIGLVADGKNDGIDLYDYQVLNFSVLRGMIYQGSLTLYTWVDVKSRLP